MNLPSRRTVVISAGLLLAAAALGHDEDGKKLRDKQPAYRGPTIKGPRAPKNGTIADFPADNVTLLSWLSLPQIGDGSNTAADCWGYVSPSGREYALLGLEKGTAFIEVTDPVNPKVVKVIPGYPSLWHDVTVLGHYAYGVSDVYGGYGIQVMDMADIDGGVVTLVQNKMQSGHVTTHTLLSNPDSNYLYGCGGNIGNGGLLVFDAATNPADPVLVNAWTTRYVHECEVVTIKSGPYAGREIAFLCTGGPTFGSGDGGLDIVDVTDKGNLVSLAHYQYPKVGYCHQGSLSGDYKYFYINDEGDEYSGQVGVTTTHVVDVSNLSAPIEAGTFTTDKTSIDHNEYVKGHYVFQSNYRSGLHVFDLAADPIKPTKIAYFDTYPQDDGAAFNSLWGNYPFLPSGIVLGSDIEKGLFVWSVGIGKLDYSFPDGLPAELDENVATPVVVQIDADEVKLKESSVTMHVQVNGGGFTATPMSSLGGGQFTADLPAGACDDAVEFYFSASTGDLRVFTSPPDAPNSVHAATVACATCYADCDASGSLDIDDFICFQTAFGIGDAYADCDESGGLDIDDFICFQTAFGIGCP